MAQELILLDAHETARVCTPAMDAFVRGTEPDLSALYELVGAQSADTFAFTNSGAEAIQQVHWTAFVERARKEGQCHFITGPLEDAPMLQSLQRLEQLGCFVKIAPVDSTGRIDVARLAELINPRTAMISLSLAPALTGVLQPIEEIAALARAKNVWLHVDASYALGKVMNPFAHADFLTFSGAMIHAVPSSGGVFARKPLVPFVLARPKDVHSLQSLTVAATHALLNLDTLNLEVARLRDLLEQALGNVLFQNVLRLPNVCTLLFPRIHQEMLHHALRRHNVCASIGGPYVPHLHRQLMATGLDEQTSRTAMSFCLSRFTNQSDIDRAIEIIRTAVQNLTPLTEELFA